MAFIRTHGLYCFTQTLAFLESSDFEAYLPILSLIFHLVYCIFLMIIVCHFMRFLIAFDC